jgi:soluble lytic murein transglycosylase-like protein
VRFRYACITWGILILALIGMTYKLNKLENIITSLNYNQTLILRQLEESEKEIKDIDKLIDKYAKQFGVDKKLCHAVAIVESGKKQEIVSSSGAVGVMQVLPQTAKAMSENAYDTESNIRAGVKYLAYLNKKFNGDTDKVIAGYNAGPNAVVKHQGIPPYKETQNYVKKVKKEKAKLENKI